MQLQSNMNLDSRYVLIILIHPVNQGKNV